MLYEVITMSGLRPEDLKMLVKTELIDGNQVMASKYISVMRRTLFYRDDAERYENLVADDKLVDADPYLGLKRKDVITSYSIHYTKLYDYCQKQL